jgi:peroxiredoxin
LAAERRQAMTDRRIRDAYDAVLAQLRESRLVTRAKKVGEFLPPFVLPNTAFKTISSADLLRHGPLIITFFRGDWCPYCALTLQALEAAMPEFAAAGATFVAIGPETGPVLLRTKTKYRLSFDLLTDAGMAYGAELGVSFTAPQAVKELLVSLNVDIPVRHGNPHWRLPVPATYVVDRSGRICYAYVDEDFTNRAEPEDVIAAVRVVSKF